MRVETLFTGFENRTAAGRQLAKALMRYRGKANTVVVGLPRGGVITARCRRRRPRPSARRPRRAQARGAGK